MTAAQNRAAYPLFAGVMDDVRAIWPDAKVRRIDEGGKTLGSIPPDSWVEIDGASVVAYARWLESDTKRGKKQ